MCVVVAALLLLAGVVALSFSGRMYNRYRADKRILLKHKHTEQSVRIAKSIHQACKRGVYHRVKTYAGEENLPARF